MTILFHSEAVYLGDRVKVVETSYDLRKKADRIAVLRLIGLARAQDPEARQDLTALLYDDDSPVQGDAFERKPANTPPRRSEDGPYAEYLRQLKAEREERLGRIESIRTDAARPAGPPADGGQRRGFTKGSVRERFNRLDRPWDDGAGSGWNWSC